MKKTIQKGDKILLPPSAFDTLARLQVDYPMLFKLSVIGNGGIGAASNNNNDNNMMLDGEEQRTTHCGVLEFTAEEGCCYIPFWMMQNLLIEEGTLLTVTNVSLPKATFVKLQPQSVDFLEISNPRAVLEHALRNYSCVTLNDIIQIPYNNKYYHFALKEVTPSPAACIIETDCNVDFDAPVGYVEPERPSEADSLRSSACPSPATTATSGAADLASNSVDGGDNDTQTTGIRIVNGQIVRPDEYDEQQRQQDQLMKSSMLANRIGSTGIQRNAAIPESAPEVKYWALNAGDGARLDGKNPAPLKDTSGNVIDIREVRAEAARRRAEQTERELSMKLPSVGKTVSGETTTIVPSSMSSMTSSENGSSTNAATSATLVSKRTKRVGSKYSSLKNGTSAFGGSSNHFGGA